MNCEAADSLLTLLLLVHLRKKKGGGHFLFISSPAPLYSDRSRVGVEVLVTLCRCKLAVRGPLSPPSPPLHAPPHIRELQKQDLLKCDCAGDLYFQQLCRDCQRPTLLHIVPESRESGKCFHLKDVFAARTLWHGVSKMSLQSKRV